MLGRAFPLALVMLLVAGCYGPGVMGWGSNGTMFEVARDDGFIQVTEVGRGAMQGGPDGAPPTYDGNLTQWKEFALQFELSGMRIAFNRPVDSSSPPIPPAKPWPLTQIANGTVKLDDRLNFCHMQADQPPYWFGVAFDDVGGSRVDYNLWFERVPRCP